MSELAIEQTIKKIINNKFLIQSMKKIFGIVLVLALVVSGCTEERKDDGTKDEEQIDEQTKGFGGITEQQCKESGGYWNECGSPCTGTDADVCIQMCQVQCECGGIAGFNCPDGYKCRLSGKIIDELGVCVPE